MGSIEIRLQRKKCSHKRSNHENVPVWWENKRRSRQKTRFLGKWSEKAKSAFVKMKIRELLSGKTSCVNLIIVTDLLGWIRSLDFSMDLIITSIQRAKSPHCFNFFCLLLNCLHNHELPWFVSSENRNLFGQGPLRLWSLSHWNSVSITS